MGDVVHLRDKTMEVFRCIDVLVNNAGIHVSSSIEGLTQTVWNRVTDIDLKGVLHCSQVIGGEMIK